MDQRLNVITLGVADVARARAFYQQLGWQVAFTDGDIVMFQAGPMIVSLWSAAKLADDSGIDAAPDGWGGFTLGYAVGGPDEVDALCADAGEAGATVTRAPVESRSATRACSPTSTATRGRSRGSRASRATTTAPSRSPHDLA
jgi:catechol 2,3-dioxygenase-like lactoylglutathione lyase family enzyme